MSIVDGRVPYDIRTTPSSVLPLSSPILILPISLHALVQFPRSFWSPVHHITCRLVLRSAISGLSLTSRKSPRSIYGVIVLLLVCQQWPHCLLQLHQVRIISGASSSTRKRCKNARYCTVVFPVQCVGQTSIRADYYFRSLSNGCSSWQLLTLAAKLLFGRGITSVVH